MRECIWTTLGTLGALGCAVGLAGGGYVVLALVAAFGAGALALVSSASWYGWAEDRRAGYRP